MSNISYMLAVVGFLLILIHIIAFMILFERKILALMQRRVGPAILGRRGFLQIIADVIKPLFKEIFEQKFQVVTAIAFSIFLLFLTQLVYASLFQLSPSCAIYSDSDFLIFLQVFFGGLSCFSVILIGYLSGTKYGLIGAVRLLVCEISTETTTCITNALLFYSSSGFDYETLISGQYASFNIELLGIIFSINHIITMFVTAQRAPLDLIENEGELVAGYNTEYSGADVLVIYFAEYLHIFNGGLQFIFLMVGGFYLFQFDGGSFEALHNVTQRQYKPVVVGVI